jgi:hypothetical protein
MSSALALTDCDAPHFGGAQGFLNRFELAKQRYADGGGKRGASLKAQDQLPEAMDPLTGGRLTSSGFRRTMSYVYLSRHHGNSPSYLDRYLLLLH